VRGFPYLCTQKKTRWQNNGLTQLSANAQNIMCRHRLHLHTSNIMSEQLKKIKQLVELRQKARLGGGEKAIEKQHAKGKATARERIPPADDVNKSPMEHGAQGKRSDTLGTCVGAVAPCKGKSFKSWRRY